jgi:hypothetical protein
MFNLFSQWGNFLFYTRNVLFPVLVAVLLLFYPPVPIGQMPGDYFLMLGLLMVLIGQALRVLTIGLAYIVRGGKIDGFTLKIS